MADFLLLFKYNILYYILNPSWSRSRKYLLHDLYLKMFANLSFMFIFTILTTYSQGMNALVFGSRSVSETSVKEISLEAEVALL